jgi:aryl-phospho-beta-D-glucosidase BglC (GH1 family)
MLIESLLSMIQQCLGLSDDTYCIVDIHNYGRFEGNILGSNDTNFIQFWTNLASKWKDDANRGRIIFELMNEPWEGKSPLLRPNEPSNPLWPAPNIC